MKSMVAQVVQLVFLKFFGKTRLLLKRTGLIKIVSLDGWVHCYVFVWQDACKGTRRTNWV